VALRIAGERNIEEIRKRVDLPVIGIVKREYPGYEPYITPTLREVQEIVNCGAEIVAFDATARPRPGGLGVAEIVGAVQRAGALAMADCALPADGVAAQAAGADVLATTPAGYTRERAGGALPAREVVRGLREVEGGVICEGGIRLLGQVAAALDAQYLFDWGGGLVWLAIRGAKDGGAARIRGEVGKYGGHATLVRASDALRTSVSVFEPLAAPLAALTARVKQSFDPQRILNRGRMYPEV